MLAAGGSLLRTIPTIGSDLTPGQYQHTSPIEELLNKIISKRGPYDLFTGERYKAPKSLVRKFVQYSTSIHWESVNYLEGHRMLFRI